VAIERGSIVAFSQEETSHAFIQVERYPEQAKQSQPFRLRLRLSWEFPTADT